MNELNVEQMVLLNGGNFFDGFCVGLAVFDAGVGLAIVAGATVATGGLAGWIWAGANAGCAVYGASVLLSD